MLPSLNNAMATEPSNTPARPATCNYQKKRADHRRNSQQPSLDFHWVNFENFKFLTDFLYFETIFYGTRKLAKFPKQIYSQFS